MNMRVLMKSRTVRQGDTFCYQMPDALFRYGRVIMTNARVGAFPKCILIYLYERPSADKLTIPELDKHELLLPPIATNLQPWTRGYFETIRHEQLTQQDRFAVHCFYSPMRDEYSNEFGELLAERNEPCGLCALASYVSIDLRVSGALGT